MWGNLDHLQGNLSKNRKYEDETSKREKKRDEENCQYSTSAQALDEEK